MAERQNISTGSEWEPIIGYSRAVKIGDYIHVSGTTGTREDGSVAAGDAEAQTMQALRNIEAALVQAGATLNDVVRTRVFVTDISRWQEYGRAHGSVFAEIRPATAIIEVSALIDSEMLVEIEADAFVG